MAARMAQQAVHGQRWPPAEWAGPVPAAALADRRSNAVDDRPADFHSPQGAVKAFLSALKAKDLDRLNEATALRAQREASSAKNQELFKKIFDLSLSDSELDELAKKLDGYTIAGENPPKSTGRVDVILQKDRRVTASYITPKSHRAAREEGLGRPGYRRHPEFKMPGCDRDGRSVIDGRAC